LVEFDRKTLQWLYIKGFWLGQAIQKLFLFFAIFWRIFLQVHAHRISV